VFVSGGGTDWGDATTGEKCPGVCDRLGLILR
jgi:hypothetical protein